MTSAAPVVGRPVLTFDEAEHVYSVNGRVAPSVTQILSAAFGDLLWPWKDSFAMERGRLVHKAAHYYTQGILDPKSLSAYIAGYLAGAIRFLDESGFEVSVSERRMYSDIYGFAGTCDWIGTHQRKRTVIDIKTGEPGYGCAPQTAAYAHLWQEETGEVLTHRYGLQLFPDGSYKLIRYASRDDWTDFLAALRVFQIRERLQK